MKHYQFGKGNEKGLKSGAFWFYYKLSFKPVNEQLRVEAAKEWKQIILRPKHKTSLQQLQAFTASNLELNLGNSYPVIDASEISRAVNEMINKEFGGGRRKAFDLLSRQFRKLLSPG